MNLSSLSVKRPVTTIMMILIVVVLGVVSLRDLPIDLLPDIEIPVAIVSTQYSNVGPEEIEQLVTRPIEEAVGTLENIDTIQSITSEGSSIVIIMFDFGTDMNFATLKMRENVDMVKGFLPDGASDPMVLQIDPTAEAIVQLSVTGSDLATLQDYSESVLKPSLERIEGVASVNVAGGFENYISVKVQPEKLLGYGLKMDTIAQMLAAENINLPAGSVFNGSNELLLRTIGEFKSIDEIKEIPITLSSGEVVHLYDVAEVSMEQKDITSITKVNGEAAVSLSIQKQSGTNTVGVANQIEKLVAQINETTDYELTIIINQADYIKSSIAQVANNGVVGGLLAVIILFIFLRSFRSTLIIGLTIPVSIIATFVLMYFMGLTLNMMTLGGLALGVGMLVDNSVVVLENIYRFVQEGKDRVHASIEGAREVALAITASTLTTVAVFLPIAFTQGLVSIIFKELSLTIVFSLFSSLVVSLTLIPMLASKLLVVDEMQGQHHNNKFKLLGWLLDLSDKVYAGLEGKYKKLLGWSINHRKTVVIFTIIVFVGSLVSMGFIGMEFMPTTDEGTFSIGIELETGATLGDTSQVIDEVVERIIDIESIDYLYSSTSGGSFMGSSNNTGSIQGVLKPKSEIEVSVFDVVDEVERRIQDIPGVKFTVDASSSMGMVGGSAISIELKGDDLEVLRELSDEIVARVETVPGTRNVNSSLSTQVPQMEITVKRNVASRFGLTTAQISNDIKTILDGRTATTYKLNGDEIDIIIEGDGRYNNSIASLEQLNIVAPTGAIVPLNLVADIAINNGPETITRIDQSRIVTVSSGISGRDLASVVSDIQNNVSDIELPMGYSINFGGQNQEMVEAFADLALALVLAILLVYMILASQFESLLTPFIIMFATPLAFAGGILGLFITNRTLNVVSIIGFIMLAGIVVNNAIVLIDYINTRRANGEDRTTAVLNAGPIRLRPILMTTLTTMLALIPLALGIGDGAELQAPMATVVIAGLLSSTLLTLVFIPVLYTIFEIRREKRRAKKERKQLKKTSQAS
jgi:HAE1 family hydrophobic/amphiphilic exporter-1